ncbi:MAG: 4Fe-4S binding protein [Coriobacteriia bacterium]|nr:4Fe-4S binding protein [Coriobacteriia bacterium]MBS5477327.1 4Fe-4S binding protein [Coriobacteriia bacterium]
MTVPAIETAAPRVRTSLGVLEALTGPGITVHQGRCVEVRNRHTTCRLCADACTSGAISFDGGCLAVDASRCIACGTCATVCPTCAIESTDPTDDELLAGCVAAAQANEGRATIACARTLVDVSDRYDPDRVACVTCLGRVDESLLAGLAAAGVAGVTLVGAGCDACEHARGREVCDEVVASADALLRTWGRELPVSFAEELPADALLAEDACGAGVFDPRRAGVMRRARAAELGVRAAMAEREPAADEASQAADASAEKPVPASAVLKVGRDGTLPHHVPTRRGRLLEALAGIGEPAEEPVATRLWASVFIDTERCGSCRLCAVFCPTGALRKFDDRRTATFGVEHEPGKCVKCHCCEDVCPERAITIVDEVYPSDLSSGHTERFEMRPRDIEPGRPDAVVKRMRNLLSASQYVNFA